RSDRAGGSKRGERHAPLSIAATIACHGITARSERSGVVEMREDRNLLIFSGNANRPLAQSVCRELGVRQGRAQVSTFSDGEAQVEIEENVRRQDVFVIQPTSAPSAEHLMELLALIDALKRASASSVTAVVPYFGY